MISKFSSQNKGDMSLAKKLPLGYSSSLPLLDYGAYKLERNGYENVGIQDEIYPNAIPYLYLPEQKRNWNHSHIIWVTDKQAKTLGKTVNILEKIPLGEEYFYQTKDFLKLNGGKWANFRRQVNYFKNHYKYEIVSKNIGREQINTFLNKWLKSQEVKNGIFASSYDFFLFCLENRARYKIKTIFILVEGELAGIAMGIKYDNKNWIGLHSKILYKYKGLGKFILHERAKLFQNLDSFTLGTGAQDKGITEFKKSIHPSKEIKYYYVITGDNK
ncbi:DUF2156 domain-containing protein [Candidatus Parcubacteria bacterium]|nr:DUF2156 domain-containing protein [Candidatus Parcubacteria bacterium]